MPTTDSPIRVTHRADVISDTSFRRHLQVTKQLLQTMAEHAAREAEVQGTLDRLACAEKEKEAGERIMQSLEQRSGQWRSRIF